MDYDKYDNQENQEVRRKRRRSRRHKNSGCAGTMVYVIAVVGASLVISLAAIFTANDVFAFVKDNAMQQFYVSENTKLAALAKDLDKQGIINYGTVFKAYLAVKGDSADDVLAGEYQLNPSMDYGQIIDKLTNSSSSDTLQITIPEGYSVAQVRQLLLDNHVCTADALDKVLNQYPFKHDFLQDEKPVEEGWLEGYLFPDTYEIYKGNGSVVDTVNKMLNNFASRYDSEITDGANERIAGVIYNRLNNSSEFPYLQVDASVLYGLGRTSGKLTDEDLKSDSPYNLYTTEGLPPGPICNPGYASLYAASHPESHDYYYYVAMPDGSHLFASSYEEHQRNIATSNAAQAQAASENTDQSTEVSGE